MKVAHPDESKAGAAGKGAAILAPVRPPMLTMSSREIAELTGKEHKHVIRDIRVMLFELVDGPNLDHVREEWDARGYTALIWLPKDLTFTLMAGYSVQMRHRIVTRWVELEAQQQTAVLTLPRNFAEALRLAADQVEQLEAHRLQLEVQRPAVEFVDRFVDSTGTFNIRQVAKLLKANERDFVAWLEERGIMYRLAGRLAPMARHMEAGRFEMKTGCADNGYAYTAPRFTPKGVQWITGEWAKYRAGSAAGVR
jgi:phage antirepressor YoqD-like protein